MSIGAGWFDLFHEGHISMFRNVLFLSVHYFRMIFQKKTNKIIHKYKLKHNRKLAKTKRA